MSAFAGPLLVLLFTLSQAFRDVFFGNVFQRLNFFAVILLAFVLSTVIFGLVTLIRGPHNFAKFRGHLKTVLVANVTTATAWTCFFFALTNLDPAICNTIHCAMGPLTVVVLGARGVALAQPGVIGRVEYACYAGIAASVVALWCIVVSGYSGLPVKNLTASVTGLALLSVSGVSITVSLLYCKRLQDHGVAADALTAVRYLALILLAAIVAPWNGQLGGAETAWQLAILLLATITLIILPLYVFQLGIGRTSPLTAQVIKALGPVFVFAMEQLDGRVHYSALTLMCILIYSGSVVLSNVAHCWYSQQGQFILSEERTSLR